MWFTSKSIFVTVYCTFPFKARRGLQRQTLCQHRLCTVIVGLMSDSFLYVCQLGISENVNQWLLAILVSSEFDSFLQSAQGPTPTQPGYLMKGTQCQKILTFTFFILSTFCYILINSHLPSLPIWSVTPRCVIQRGLLYFENISMKIINYLQNHVSLLFRRVSFMKSKYDNKSRDTVALIKQQHHDETPTVGNSQPLVSCTVSCTVVQT